VQKNRTAFSIADRRPSPPLELRPGILNRGHRWLGCSKAKDQMFAHTTFPKLPGSTVKLMTRVAPPQRQLPTCSARSPMRHRTPEAISSCRPRKSGGGTTAGHDERAVLRSQRLSLICRVLDSASPRHPGHGPLRGRLVSLIYSGSDGRQYIVSGMARKAPAS